MRKVIGGVFTCIILGTLCLLFTGCQSEQKNDLGTNATQNDVTIAGSTSLQPLVEKAVKLYKEKIPGARITVEGGGSAAGLMKVQNGTAQIGNSDIFAEQQEGIHPDKLRDYRVAVVGVAPVVNKDVGITNVTMSQLRDIFLGRITNWQQLGGKNEKISVITRTKDSGTRTTFQRAVLYMYDKPVKTQEQTSNQDVKDIVEKTPGAVSYLPFSYLNDTNNIQTLTIDRVAPNYQNVSVNKWKIWSYEHMYTRGKPKVIEAGLLKYLLSAPVQNNLLPKFGYYSTNKMKVKMNEIGEVSSK